MTDTKLLPLPEGVDVIFSPDGNGAALDVFTAEQVQDYARANVAHATAEQAAEIEALRAELIRVTNPDGSPNLHAEQSGAAESYRAAALHAIQKREQAEARAERLVEALRELVEYVQETAHHNAPAAAAARAALRDHDQEVDNG